MTIPELIGYLQRKIKYHKYSATDSIDFQHGFRTAISAFVLPHLRNMVSDEKVKSPRSMNIRDVIDYLSTMDRQVQNSRNKYGYDDRYKSGFHSAISYHAVPTLLKLEEEQEMNRCEDDDERDREHWEKFRRMEKALERLLYNAGSTAIYWTGEEVQQIVNQGLGRLKGCPTCGGKLVFVRGKHPNEDKREVCPTCLQEKMDKIHEETNPKYEKGCSCAPRKEKV